MLYTKADKTIILDLFPLGQTGKQFQFDRGPTIPAIGGDDILLVWKEDDYPKCHLPIYICTPKTKLREFLAWVSTYLKQMKPFTSYTRVVDVDEFMLLENMHGMGSPIPAALPNALIGLVIGETIELQKKGLLKHVNTMATMNTLSYAIATALIHKLPFRKIDVVNRFSAARRLIGASYSAQFLTSITGIWQNYLQFSDKYLNHGETLDDRLSFRPICTALECIEAGNDVSLQLVEAILRQPIHTSAVPTQNQKIEDRVESFEELCELISSDRQIHSQSASFLIGCMANQLSPGTMKHVSLLNAQSSTFPGLYAWYGLCAGLSPNSEVHFNNGGLGWRIAKHLYAEPSFIDLPTSDICFNELELLLTQDTPDSSFSTDWANNLSIELFPGISIIGPWPPRAQGDRGTYRSENQNQMDLFKSNSTVPDMETCRRKLHELIDLFDNFSEDVHRQSKYENRQKSKGSKSKGKY